MNAHKPQQRKVDRGEIQRNAARLALVIFFVATVSAAGGFLQGERVATLGISNVAAVTTDYSFLKQNHCDGGKCIFPRPKGALLFICPPAGGDCSVTFKPNDPNDGEALSRPLNSEESKALRDRMRELGGDGDDEKADGKPGECGPSSTEPKCLDKCTTSYVKVEGEGKATVAACIEVQSDPVRSAMDKVAQACPDAKGDWKNVWKAHKCDAEPVSESEIGGDAGETPAVPDRSDPDILSATAILAAAKTTSAACKAAKAELKTAIEESLKKAKTPPQNLTAPSCKLGAVVCFNTGADAATPSTPNRNRDPFLIDPDRIRPSDDAVTAAAILAAEVSGTPTAGKIECCNKHDKACIDKLNKALGRPATTTQTTTGFNQCKGKTGFELARCLAQAAAQTFNPNASTQNPFNGQNPFSQSPGSPGSPGGGKPSSPSSNNSGNNNNQCPSGYTQSTENGRIVCTKKNDEATKPQCLFVTSKEKIKAGETVTLRWRTANAETVNIDGIGSNLSKNSQKSIKPTETKTYKLTAKGKGSNNDKTCEVTVTVDGEVDTGPTGSAPPKLSCAPSTVAKGKSARVKWACTAAAEESTGEGLDTGGKLAGEITVNPEHNTEYTVMCLDKDKEEIGKDSCSVSVGEAKYDIIVHPTVAKRGDRVRVSWASLFMKSCHVQGPRGFDYTRTQGVVITEPFNLDEDRVPNRNIRAAVYNIECESQFGGRVSKDVTVRFQE